MNGNEHAHMLLRRSLTEVHPPCGFTHTRFILLQEQNCRNVQTSCAVFLIRGAIERPNMRSGPLFAAKMQLKVELCGCFNGFIGCKYYENRRMTLL